MAARRMTIERDRLRRTSTRSGDEACSDGRRHVANSANTASDTFACAKGITDLGGIQIPIPGS